MSAQSTTEVPSVEVVISEVVANLVFVAHGYLEPAFPSESGPDLAAADIVIDLAGKAFERIQTRLQPEERSAFARLLTDLRMTYIRKRGL